MLMFRRVGWLLRSVVAFVAGAAPGLLPPEAFGGDYVRDLQTQAIERGHAEFGHWGTEPGNYTAWGTHTNRLVPVYTFGTRGAGQGIDLDGYTGKNSPYRNPRSVAALYGRVPSHTVNPDADYLDQTNIADIQRAALAGGKKHIFLVIFDGMDWQTTHAAATVRTGKVAYQKGRGTGLHFLDYQAQGTTQYGFAVAASHSDDAVVDVDRQAIVTLSDFFGGYNAAKAGPNPWAAGNDPLYLIGKSEAGRGEHCYPDSAPTAAAMTTGVKSYNGSINVDPAGVQLTTIAHLAQEQGFAVGAVTSVPVSHATPAAAYAHNVSRDDYQDLTRDLVGLPSVSHPKQPLRGLDVLIGGGFGVVAEKSAAQGSNFVPGNQFLTDDDLRTIDLERGGEYMLAVRTAGRDGSALLQQAAQRAARDRKRLFGFFGLGKYKGHLPFQTADGDYRPAPGRTSKAESYSQADITENPTLAEMTAAALTVLGAGDKGFWLMVEAGDVDWANHDDNIDNSIGAVFSGDAAVKAVTDWVEQHSNWHESLLIVTADHGHYLVLTRPELLVESAGSSE